jgi:hypothetical protein
MTATRLLHRIAGDRSAPAALRVVAVLFVVLALFTVADIVQELVRGRLSLDIGVLGFWIGPGLLRYQRHWRTWALLFAGLGIVGFLIGAAMVLLGDGLVTVTVLAHRYPDLPGWTLFVLRTPVALAHAFVWWVLTRPDVRASFRRVERPRDEAPVLSTSGQHA